MVTILVMWLLAGVSCVFVAIGVNFLTSRAHEKELARLMYVFEQAMLLSRPGAVVEKEQAQGLRKSADLQLKILEDALAYEQDKKEKDEKEAHPEPRFVSGFDSDGKPVEVDLNEYEVVE